MRFYLLFLAIFTFFNASTALSYLCDLEFAPIHRLEGSRNIEDLAKTNIGTFNVLNLEFSPGKYLNNPGTGKREFVTGTIKKQQAHVQEIADIIKSEKLDILIMQEVEGIEPLLRFNSKYLNDEYQVIMQKGNDTRGIEIGFLVKKDLPFDIRLHSHAHKSEVTESGKQQRIFSRDLPSLHIRFKTTSMNDPPDLIVSGTHYKSQRDRKGDPNSAQLRTRQAQETRTILEEYKNVYPETPILIGGDFNADVHTGQEFKGLFEGGFLTDSFDVLAQPLSKEQRITQTFHPFEGDTKYSQLDAILVDSNAAPLVNDAKVFRYKNADGKEKPIPKTYEERKKNPSDHFMVLIETDLKRLATSR